MDDRNDRRRDRLSWAEIDKLRDQSRHRERDPLQKQSSPTAITAQKSYRAALERAFAAGKLGELANTLARTSGDVRPPSAQQPLPPPAPAAAPAAAAASPASAPAEPPEADAAPPGSGAAAAATPTPTPTPVARDPDREQKQKLLGKIRDAEGREAVTRAVDTFLGRYPK